MNNNNKHPQSMDPHGYHPILVNENCLTDAECGNAVIACVSHQQNWSSCITKQERQTYRQDLVDIQERERIRRLKLPNLVSCAEPEYSMKCRYIELAQMGLYRLYARDKYAAGRPIWCGDGPPPWQR